MHCLYLSELNKLVALLDDRANKSAGKNSFHRKERVQKSPCSVQPPTDAPKWTLKRIHETSPAPVARAVVSEEESSEWSS